MFWCDFEGGWAKHLKFIVDGREIGRCTKGGNRQVQWTPSERGERLVFSAKSDHEDHTWSDSDRYEWRTSGQRPDLVFLFEKIDSERIELGMECQEGCPRPGPPGDILNEVNWCTRSPQSERMIKDLSIRPPSTCLEDATRKKHGFKTRAGIVGEAIRAAKDGKRDEALDLIKVCQCHNPSVQAGIDAEPDRVFSHLKSVLEIPMP